MGILREAGVETVTTYSIRFDSQGRLVNCTESSRLEELFDMRISSDMIEKSLTFKELNGNLKKLLGPKNLDVLIDGIREMHETDDINHKIKYDMYLKDNHGDLRHLVFLGKKDLLNGGWQLILNEDIILHQQIWENEKKFEDRKAELKEKEQLYKNITFMEGSVRHEMYTPLYAVKGYLKSLLKKIKNNTYQSNSGQIDIESLDECIQKSEFLCDQVEKLRAFSRKTDAISEFDFERVSKRHVIPQPLLNEIRKFGNETIKTYTMRFDSNGMITNAMGSSTMASHLGIQIGPEYIGKHIHDVLAQKWKPLFDEDDISRLTRQKEYRYECDITYNGEKKHLLFLSKKDKEGDGWQMIINEDIVLHNAIEENKKILEEYQKAIDDKKSIFRKIKGFSKKIKNELSKPILEIISYCEKQKMDFPDINEFDTVYNEALFVKQKLDILGSMKETYNMDPKVLDICSSVEEIMSKYYNECDGSERSRHDDSARINLTYIFEKDCDPPTLYVRMDYNALETVLKNFMGNIIHKAEESYRNKQQDLLDVQIKIGRINDDVFLEFEDNGGGIDEESKQRLGEIGFSTKGKKGTGIGLPTNIMIASELGGYMDFSGGDMDHAAIRMYLPLHAQA